MAKQIVVIKGLKGIQVDFNGKKGYTNDKVAINGKIHILFPDGVKVPSISPLGKVMCADIPANNVIFVVRKAITTK